MTQHHLTLLSQREFAHLSNPPGSWQNFDLRDCIRHDCAIGTIIGIAGMASGQFKRLGGDARLSTLASPDCASSGLRFSIAR